jgi:hypothetical protein
MGSTRNHIEDVAKTLRAVFRKSGVEGATSHRFRHTLTTEILVKGGTIEDAANILGDSPAIIRKHYAKWSADYQHRTVEVFRRIHGTSMSHDKNTPRSAVDSAFMLVPGVGLETWKVIDNKQVIDFMTRTVRSKIRFHGSIAQNPAQAPLTLAAEKLGHNRRFLIRFEDTR